MTVNGEISQLHPSTWAKRTSSYRDQCQTAVSCLIFAIDRLFESAKVRLNHETEVRVTACGFQLLLHA